VSFDVSPLAAVGFDGFGTPDSERLAYRHTLLSAHNSPGMQYLWYALVALVAYTLVAPLSKLAMRDLPSDTVAAVTNGVLALTALALVVATDKPLASAFTRESSPYLIAAAVCLTVGIIAYYRALASGPVSIVVPIFGLFLVGSSVVGIAFLGESLTLRKGVGVLLAIVAVFLTTFEG
jgi:transporter family protein